MKVTRIDASDGTLLISTDSVWKDVESRKFPLVPTPLNGNPMIKKISPFIEKSTDHGIINEVTASASHNGNILAVRLSWVGEKHDKIVDLDEFVDGAAVMFPLTNKSSALTMGSDSDPVNAWYWKANLEDSAFDVIARGYGTSGRQKNAHHPITCNAVYEDGRWNLVLARAMDDIESRARFTAGGATRIAFAIWDGGNRERSGRKSFSGDFVPVPIDP